MGGGIDGGGIDGGGSGGGEEVEGVMGCQCHKWWWLLCIGHGWFGCIEIRELSAWNYFGSSMVVVNGGDVHRSWVVDAASPE